MIHIFDGAMGTMLQAGGLKPGGCPELMNIEHPEVVRDIHRAYIEAGATIIETNTFGASRLKLDHYGLENRVQELNAAAVRIAREAAKGQVKIAGSMGPTGRFISPLGDLDFEEAYDCFQEQASALANAGVDFFIIETCIDIQEMRAALLAAKDAAPDIPVICQLTYSDDGRTVTGTDPQSAAIILSAMGADIIGVNCSLGPEQLVPIVKTLSENCSCPISVQPNAGMPQLVDGETHFPMGPEDFGSWGPKLLAAGATYLGGCCGTTPAHIRALAAALAGCAEPKRTARPQRLWLASRSKSVCIDQALPTVLIGERINPTGRKKLAAEIREGSLLSVKKEAVNQVKAGAQLLDVNMGVAGIDAVNAMKQAVTEIAQLTDAPLAIDTSDAAALEAGLRAYPGRALINSVSAEDARIRDFLPLAKKYGAAILCLPITEDGVPKTAEARLKTVQFIIGKAKEAGLKDGDFLLDALVMTVSADKDACREVLRTLQLYRQHLGYPATMGLSNISFGLPNRPLINSTFFAMCLAAGLDAPIMNPYDESMQKALKASAALLGDDPCGLAFSQDESNLAVPRKAAVMKTTDLPILDAIKQAVIEGEKDIIVGLVIQALQEGKTGNEITENGLTAAMTEIGEDFGSGRMFLPQVLLSAETMRAAFDKLKELIPASANADKGTFVIATVKGDVHDLGKNITGALLANSGFKVIDLGKDVDADTIVRAAKEHQADIVGLAALMTTTMPQIDKVIAKLREENVKARVMIGGAAVTQDYADACGADAYAADGVKAVKLAKQMVGAE
ncbi:homocysteine S-methyltransferase family protein [Mitsuokella sp.]|uniref:homocysteine S-methyltransferase family protein n=1 Tax=Mitsuokella TaxID=52225 RepID=UPI0029E274C9|nr:homocysteine S-methyltransferase family protein [Mitsuokella sp.]MDD6381861.1 homocysteine S-methyltransferase family protein [Selenomonadaceae bacterium]MDY4475431.1 homocysteine S-methyltransferase family protein [Mitsuokella sp.]